MTYLCGHITYIIGHDVIILLFHGAARQGEARRGKAFLIMILNYNYPGMAKQGEAGQGKAFFNVV